MGQACFLFTSGSQHPWQGRGEGALTEFCPGGGGVVLSLGGVAEASTEPMNVLVDFYGCVCGITGLEWGLGYGDGGVHTWVSVLGKAP